MSDPVEILIAHADEQVRKTLVDAIQELDYQIQATVSTCAALFEKCHSDRPDLVISGVDMPDGDAVEALVKIGEEEPIPAIVVTDQDSLHDVERALQDHVMAYLLEPIASEHIQPTIYLVLRRFEQFEALREEVQDLRQALTDRKVIERAKGILMSVNGFDEADAFRYLQRLATEKRSKLAAAAQRVIDAQEG